MNYEEWNLKMLVLRVLGAVGVIVGGVLSVNGQVRPIVRTSWLLVICGPGGCHGNYLGLNHHFYGRKGKSLLLPTETLWVDWRHAFADLGFKGVIS